MAKEKIFLILIILFLFLAIWSLGTDKVVQINDVLIKVELAKTPEQRSQGLSDQAELAEDQGMLFIFDEPDIYPFWMKDMLLSLDIIWMDQECRIVGIGKNISPDTFPQIFESKEPVKYALEVNGGFCDKHNIKIGDLALCKNLGIPIQLRKLFNN